MSVSSRHILTGAVAAFALTIAGGVAVAGGGPDGFKRGVSQGGTHARPAQRPNFQPQVRQPKIRPNFAPNVVVPSVRVDAPNLIVRQGDVSVTQSSVFLGGTIAATGGGFFGNGGFATPSTPVAPSALDGLVVDGADQVITETVTQQVPITEETCVPQVTSVSAVRPVQAVCIDDKGTPHPSSQVTAEQNIDGTYQGELFRCLAGTHMQVTVGQQVNGQSNFDQAETFSCRKGEALVYGHGGSLTCAPQAPQRNCNERSLLRRHGPGVKLVKSHHKQQTCVPQQRTTYRTVSNQVQKTIPNKNGPIVLDGGVGQGVF